MFIKICNHNHFNCFPYWFQYWFQCWLAERRPFDHLANTLSHLSKPKEANLYHSGYHSGCQQIQRVQKSFETIKSIPHTHTFVNIPQTSFQTIRLPPSFYTLTHTAQATFKHKRAWRVSHTRMQVTSRWLAWVFCTKMQFFYLNLFFSASHFEGRRRVVPKRRVVAEQSWFQTERRRLWLSAGKRITITHRLNRSSCSKPLEIILASKFSALKQLGRTLWNALRVFALLSNWEWVRRTAN